ncbi:hypothetical protein KYK29_17630 [Shinella daejeonensis]|uniref:hypothetical protein n=1 Tax=Shinella daejeonensis TaxID=659017 RepID=UPI0020C79194|nr:hypothetical protein [Shinella daejeonensis]MCP8896750.1 hypothetical protein [Shinella daejeonensis]
MAFGPARPPMMEDVAEVIAKEVKEGEGHRPTSEVPLAFLRKAGGDKPLEMNARVRMFLIAAAAAVAVLFILLALL